MLRLRSKSRKKESKYIPAAIIPSAAFVANPTLTTPSTNISDSSNKLLDSTLNSSLVGLSSEYRKHQINGSRDSVDNFGLSYEGGYDVPERRDSHESRARRKQKTESLDQHHKRHINIANGLFDNGSSLPRREIGDNDGVDDNERSRSSLVQNQSFNKNVKDGVVNLSDSRNGRMEFEYRGDHEDPYCESEVARFVNGTSVQDGETGRVPLGFEAITDVTVHTGSHGSQHSQVLFPVPQPFKSVTNKHHNDDHEDIYSVPTRGHKTSVKKHQGNDHDERQTRDEISLLKDTIYRLNVEISHLLPSQEAGRPIGKSVLPGKGPAPSWIMNTKYLTPLIAAYDKKFERQNESIQTMKMEMAKFEKEIRDVMNENERLHLKLQGNSKSGPGNHSEWPAFVGQMKLVIEENQLLLEELDLHQTRNAEYEKKYEAEMLHWKTSLDRVTSERDAGREEIVRLGDRISEMISSANATITTASTAHVNMITEIEDLLKDKGSLEKEVEILRGNERKMKKKIDKLKLAMNSEKDFRQYLNDVIDKGNEISDERDRLAEMMRVRDGEIRRLASKTISDIKFKIELGIDMNSDQVTMVKSEDVSLQQLYMLEAWTDMLVQSAVDLVDRCRQQEKDVHYYQNLLREKDKSLQEYEKENEALESKVDSLWRNATKDS